MIVEKAGLHINAEKEVIGWVAVGTDVDTKEGDVIVTHAKTAAKLGVAEQYAFEKAANKPKKERSSVRVATPVTGTYTVISNRFTKSGGARGEIASAVLNNTHFENLFAAVPETFTSVGRNGEEKSHSTKAFVRYLIRRGMIEIAA